MDTKDGQRQVRGTTTDYQRKDNTTGEGRMAAMGGGAGGTGGGGNGAEAELAVLRAKFEVDPQHAALKQLENLRVDVTARIAKILFDLRRFVDRLEPSNSVRNSNHLY